VFSSRLMRSSYVADAMALDDTLLLAYGKAVLCEKPGPNDTPPKRRRSGCGDGRRECSTVSAKTCFKPQPGVDARAVIAAGASVSRNCHAQFSTGSAGPEEWIWILSWRVAGLSPTSVALHRRDCAMSG